MLTRAQIREVNRTHRAVSKTESRLWPIRGRFDVAERAIQTVRRLRAAGLEIYDAEDYDNTLTHFESIIVNDSRNW
jgi:hypothetical protein